MAHNNLAGVLIARGAVDDAVGHAEIALALKPDYAEARNNLGLALASRGRIDEALGQYQKALELQPEYAEAHNNLGFLLAEPRAGRRGDHTLSACTEDRSRPRRGPLQPRRGPDGSGAI